MYLKPFIRDLIYRLVDRLSYGGAGIPVMRGDAGDQPAEPAAAQIVHSDYLLRECDTFGSFFGAVPAYAAARRAGLVAARILRMRARTLGRADVEPDVLREALFFPLLTELCGRLPMRRLARRDSKLFGQRRILVRLDSMVFTYGDYWEPYQMAPLIYAAELQRLGANVAISLPGHDLRSPPRLLLRRSPQLSGRPDPGRSRPHWNSIIAPAGIRGLTGHPVAADDPCVIAGAFNPADPAAYCSIWPEKFRLPNLQIRGFRAAGNRSEWRIDLDIGKVDRRLWSAAVSLIVLMSRTADKVMKGHGGKDFHCADHLFLEAAVGSGAARRNGLKVHLWPHSSGPVGVNERVAPIDTVRCVTRAGAERWRRKYPRVETILAPELLKLDRHSPCRFSPNEPLSVIIFAGARLLRLTPTVPVDEYVKSHREFIRRVSSVGHEHIRLYYKAKGEWETEAWFRNTIDPERRCAIVTSSSFELDLPNPVFLTVARGSTALLEGICMGAPALVLRDFPCDDYIDIGAPIVIGDCGRIAGELEKLRSTAYRASLVEAQQAWLRSV